jgi:hypothetical protein
MIKAKDKLARKSKNRRPNYGQWSLFLFTLLCVIGCLLILPIGASAKETDQKDYGVVIGIGTERPTIASVPS